MVRVDLSIDNVHVGNQRRYGAIGADYGNPVVSLVYTLTKRAGN